MPEYDYLNYLYMGMGMKPQEVKTFELPENIPQREISSSDWDLLEAASGSYEQPKPKKAYTKPILGGIGRAIVPKLIQDLQDAGMDYDQARAIYDSIQSGKAKTAKIIKLDIKAKDRAVEDAIYEQALKQARSELAEITKPATKKIEKKTGIKVKVTVPKKKKKKTKKGNKK